MTANAGSGRSQQSLRHACFLLALLAANAASAAEPADLLREFDRAQIIIAASSQRCIVFDVYIAETRQQRSQGLMFVRSMPLYEGMLFSYNVSTNISMWMKNTLIPLDMVFFDSSLRISNVHRNAVPLSTDIIDGGIAAGVIELNGGAAELFGIQAGDRILVPGN